MRNVKLSASIMCANLLRLEEDLRILGEAGFDSLHFDMMDGHFVPEIGFGVFFLEQLTTARTLPVDVHLMVTDPQRFIEPLADAGAALVSVHCEADGDLQNTLRRIRGRNMKAGLAMRPDTPLETLVPHLELLDLVLLMAYPPGVRNQKAEPDFERKIRGLAELLEQRGSTGIDIAVDGGVSLDLMATYRQAGSNYFILGSSGLFLRGVALAEQIRRIRTGLSLPHEP